MTVETTANGILADRSSPATAIDRAKKLLANDVKVKVAGIDCDGILRGKVMHKDKFLSSLQSGFGMSSVTFGWDMHDVLFDEETSLIANGVSYEDLTALIDLESFRRLPFEDDLAFFLLHFSVAGKPVSVDGRSMAKSLTEKLASNNFKALAGGRLPPTQLLHTSKANLFFSFSRARIHELPNTDPERLRRSSRPPRSRRLFNLQQSTWSTTSHVRLVWLQCVEADSGQGVLSRHL